MKLDLGAPVGFSTPILGASLGDSLRGDLWNSLWDSLRVSLRRSLWDSLKEDRR